MSTNTKVSVKAFFSLGFRPFFLFAGVSAVLIVSLWVAALAGYVWPYAPVNLMQWHAQEMLFGFAAAAIAGFLLTAIANFTGRAPISGAALALLFLSWLAARFFSALPGLFGQAFSDLMFILFPLLLFLFLARELIADGGKRNLVIGVLLALFVSANFLYITGSKQALELAPHLVVLFITLFGGRIIPSFTSNWLRLNQISHPPILPKLWLEYTILPATLFAGALDTLLPMHTVTGVVLLFVAGLHLLRVSAWQGWRTGKAPILWVLHLGYLWVALGYALLGLSVWLPLLVHSTALHALTAGAMGTLILGVMSRVALGHTGRPLEVNAAITIAYGLVTIATLARILLVFNVQYQLLLAVSALAWVLAFGIFVIVYAPMLLSTRADGRD